MIRPFFFGPEERRLFGIFHLPARPRNHGIVLCYPHAYEYIRCHRAFRELTNRLVRMRFQVMTFDYYGCGDSAGEYEEGRLKGWCQDTSWAVDSMKKNLHIDRVGLLGLRLGASIAMRVAAERDDIDTLVLWDPVVNGQDLVEEMMSLQSTILRRKPPYKYGDDTYDVLGYPLTSEMMKDLETLDLLKVSPLPKGRAFIAVTGEENGRGSLHNLVEKIGANVFHQHIQETGIWLKEPYEAIVPQKTLQLITAWLSEVYP